MLNRVGLEKHRCGVAVAIREERRLYVVGVASDVIGVLVYSFEFCLSASF